MPYDLLSDGKQVPLGDRKYLLSPQDLAGLDVLPELSRLGIASLKIEGRLKSPEYVANITRIYREALDALGGAGGQKKGPSRTGQSRKEKAEETSEAAGTRPSTLDARPFQYEMEMAFSRGLHTGWFRGINNQALVHARFGKKRGVYLGEISRVDGERVFLNLQAPLKPGDEIGR